MFLKVFLTSLLRYTCFLYASVFQKHDYETYIGENNHFFVHITTDVTETLFEASTFEVLVLYV